MRFVLHTFRPTETIDAVIRLVGHHSLSKVELLQLRNAFNELNGEIVPRPGMTYKIPLPFEVTNEFGDVVFTTSPEETDDGFGF
jgi:hypothetical protein